MRGGRIYIRGDVGYRVGIHMKAYEEQHPVLVIGGHARDFFGEYMAGGEMLLLGLDDDRRARRGFLRGHRHARRRHLHPRQVAAHQLGKEVGVTQPTAAEAARIEELVTDFCRVHRLDPQPALVDPFVKISPFTLRPYGKMYAY